MHDPRVGRFFAIDPLAAKYPHNSPYAFSENRVVDGIELEGLEVYVVNAEARAGVFLYTTALSISFAWNLEGDMALMMTSNHGLGIIAGGVAGISAGIYDVDKPSDLAGWGANVGGFAQKGTKGLSVEFNFALSTKKQPEVFNAGSDYDRLFEELEWTVDQLSGEKSVEYSTGKTTSYVPGLGFLPGYGYGGGGYADVSYTWVLDTYKIDVPNLYEQVKNRLQEEGVNVEEVLSKSKFEHVVEGASRVLDYVDEFVGDQDEIIANPEIMIVE